MPNAPERVRRPLQPAETLADLCVDALGEAILLVDLSAPDRPIVFANRAARGLFAAPDGVMSATGVTAAGGTPGATRLTDWIAAPEAEALCGQLAALAPEDCLTRVVRWRTNGGELWVATECRALREEPERPPGVAHRLARPPGAGLVLLKFAAAAHARPGNGAAALAAGAPLSVLRALTERAYDVILVTDAAGGILFVSGGIANALGFTPDERRAENLFDRVHAEDRGPLRAQYRRLVSGELPGFTVEYRAQHKDGSYRWMHASYVAALDDPLIGGIVVNSRDVTDRKRLEEELRAVSSRERQRIGRDLHDGLGQELTGVALMLRGLARRLEAHCPEAIPATNEAIGLVNQSIETARSLARGLLPVSADEGGLVNALRSLAKRAAALYGIDVRCRFEPWLPLPLAVGDASHLYRISQEALTNAVRHGQARRVEIRLEVDGEHYALTISDDGEGMPEESLTPHGLGLRIMAHRARLLDANLDVRANTPRGTCVRVSGMQRAAVSQV